MIYLYDTNILLHYIRQSTVMQYVEASFQPFSEEHEPWVCVVSHGELRSIAIQNKWGAKRIQEMFEMLDNFLLIDIGSKDIYNRYAEIDAFSQGKLPGRPLHLTSRNMGKNDLWIAATASILGATLLTTDVDFEHLDGAFLKVERVGV